MFSDWLLLGFEFISKYRPIGENTLTSEELCQSGKGEKITGMGSLTQCGRGGGFQ